MSNNDALEAIEHINAVIRFLQTKPDVYANIENRGPLRLFLLHLKRQVDEALESQPVASRGVPQVSH